MHIVHMILNIYVDVDSIATTTTKEKDEKKIDDDHSIGLINLRKKNGPNSRPHSKIEIAVVLANCGPGKEGNMLYSSIDSVNNFHSLLTFVIFKMAKHLESKNCN
ncbi:hypothetical protein DERF_004411 [Dermatophagoides farinae]|uniref:Uncharacterized protein n=1 Tax=Dermatophagoides farinae TaxID=6954 RepID=A0A922LA16_DERFA|nr:hypothetical protein DERF_004411 [Dermatophagoides farinae]